LTYLERQKCYGPYKKILFKKHLFDREVKGMAALRGDISFRYLKQFFLVLTKLTTSRQGVVFAVSYNIESTIFLL
jgi:hypothetical protein